ncbi:MAG: type II/IV secretion system protein [Parcubacteria group bacterium]|nr:type II/IV secretion system protein [Parcubacteria group bacterium]
MSQDNPSIEDLLKKQDAPQPNQPASGSQDEGAQEQLSEKIGQIERVGLEKEVEQQAAQLGFGYVDFATTSIDREALLLLSREEMAALSAAVFLNRDGELRLATTNPSDAVAQKMDQLAKEQHAHAARYLISEDSLKKAFETYDRIPKKTEIKDTVSITADDLKKYEADVSDISSLPAKLDTIPLTDVMTIILAAAIHAEASDIHIEAEEEGIKLRFRLDGVLHDEATLTREMWEHMISRIKLLSHLKLNVTDKPQDGRISIELPDDKLDIRVSTIPTAYGESVVMRLLRSSAVGLQFEDLGLRGKSFNDLKREVERPNGMILTTGPTGSGKTTTLYAILNKLNDEETKIITLEDPIEYKLKGINQSQIEKSHDYDFAKGLRSILRQDPDVVMVGEIRDMETADVAINAALTGHLVLSTLHTNDASGAIPRFLAIGIAPFLLAPAVNAIIGQRLVRKICEHCREQVALDSAMLGRVLEVAKSIPTNAGASIDPADAVFYHGRGCAGCNNSGYKGRIGIFEIFTITPEIEKMILDGKVSESDIKASAQKAGMLTMVQDGILKAADGVTTVDEVFRVTE